MGGATVFKLFGKLAIDGVDESKKALDDVSESGKKAKDDLTVSFNDIATKAGELGTKMAIGLAGVVTAAVAGVEATREFRQDYGKLETTFETTNQATGAAKETFTTLFGILGEDDTAIETANHLAMMTNNEKDLAQWTDVLTGVYATFGDSLPLEGLAEAANETARVGTVTGSLADALNWAGISEDDFNAKLEKCNTTADREKLIRETLNGLYGEASTTYKTLNGDVIANNEAQANLNMELADAAAKLEPLITKGKEFLVNVLEKAQPLIDWVVENFDLIAPIILGIVAALTVFSTTMGIVNAVMMASPVTWIVLGIVAAIAALIAIIVLVVKNWDKIKETASNVWNKIKEVWGAVAEWFNTNVVQPIVNFFTSLWEGLKAIWDGIVNAIKFAFNLIVTIITTYIQLITLPFRFIWENCKELVFKAFEWIKEKINSAITFIKNIVQKGFNLVQKYIIDPITKAKDWVVETFQLIKDQISAKINQVKSFIKSAFEFIKDKIITPIVNAKNKVVETVTGIKDKVVDTFNSVKTKVTDIFNKVKTAITTPIENAKNTIKGIVDKIKGFFKFNIEFPKIKLPHFKVKPSGWGVGDLLKGTIPKLSIDWYAKAVNSPMLLEKPTAFGISPSGNIRVGGETSSEIVGGTNTIMNMIGEAVSSNNSGIEYRLDKLNNNLASYTEEIRNLRVVLSTGELVGALTSPLDKSLGQLADDRRRGR